MYRIALAIENPSVNLAVQTALQQQGYFVWQEASGASGNTYPDLLVTTTTHPLGWQRLQTQHQYCEPLVVVLASSQEDASTALEQGADDVVWTPYSLKEIAVRIGVRLRNRRVPAHLLRYGPVVIDKDRYHALVDDHPLEITPQEMQLLLVFLEAGGEVCTKQHLYQQVWRTSYIEGDRALDAAILRLKRKLGVVGTSIETIRSRGYCLRALHNKAS
jgi:DNA-binding response OmpR family regulator